ncbi:DMT family transporter [Chitinophaga sp. GCM10012297]|uniref:DMT family transporter n=1 Tax=Chitinophaga chungangae TaxID=2821488 RepID=A0ABS3YC79_9BACT|nr:DMT family transporter [Chitinophaga chungangae]MBO9152285.1 DMT family transporter [Chitinophaga chungangae]
MPKLHINEHTKGLISIIFVMLIWGSSFTVTKTVVSEVPPFIFAGIRNLIGCAALLPFYLARRRKATQPLPYGKLVLMGLAGTTFYYFVFNTGMKYVSASSGALIEGLVPVAIAIPAAFILKEHLAKRTIAGIVLSVAGVILVGFIGASDKSANALLGSSLIVGAVLLWSAYTLLSRSVKEYDTVLVTTVSTFIGTALSLPLPAYEIITQGMPDISWKAWAGMVYLGVFASAVAYSLYNRALENLPAAQVGNFLNLNPVIGALIAFIFLKEKLTALQLAGGILVLAGIWLSSKKTKTNP